MLEGAGLDPQDMPSLKKWIDDVGSWDLRHYLVHNVPVSQAVSVCAVLWPRFVEMEGCLFIDYLFDAESYSRWRRELGDDNRAIEKVVNHVHLWDLFAPVADGEYAALATFASKMAEIWRVAARAEFPNREITVDLIEENEDYGPTLVLYS